MGDDRSDSRDYVMARLLAARAAAASSIAAIDEIAIHFLDPADDEGGKKRKDLLEEADDSLGVAAQCIQSAMVEFPEVDTREAEELGDVEEDDEEEDEEEEEPAKPRRRRRDR